MIMLGADFLYAGKTEMEIRLLGALHHLMHKDHEFDARGCAGCRDIAAWLTVPGYKGECGGPV